MDSSLPSYSTVTHRGKTLFLEARLLGGAPWGFQLKGGLEHGEELIVSKVRQFYVYVSCTPSWVYLYTYPWTISIFPGSKLELVHAPSPSTLPPKLLLCNIRPMNTAVIIGIKWKVPKGNIVTTPRLGGRKDCDVATALQCVCLQSRVTMCLFHRRGIEQFLISDCIWSAVHVATDKSCLELTRGQMFFRVPHQE